jgi:hypothetical protein
MLTAKDHVLDGDTKRANDISLKEPGHILPIEVSDTESSRSVSPLSHQGAHENEENESNAKIPDQGESILIEEGKDAEPHDFAAITPEKQGRALLREMSATKESASPYFSSQQMASSEDEENESNAKIANRVECEWEALTTPTPVAEEKIYGVEGNLPVPEGKDTFSGGEPATLDKGIISKVEKLLPLSKETHMVSGEKSKRLESIERELAEAKAENAKLRADLDSERAEQKGASGIGKGGQDDPFAPREGKTLLWTGVTMTLVRSKSLLFEDSARCDTSLTMLPILSSFIHTRYDSLRKAKDQNANCSTMSGARFPRKRLPPSWGPREPERLRCSTFLPVACATAPH